MIETTWSNRQIEATREIADLHNLDGSQLSDADCVAFLDWRRDRRRKHKSALHAIVWTLSDEGQAELAAERDRLADLIESSKTMEMQS